MTEKAPWRRPGPGAGGRAARARLDRSSGLREQEGRPGPADAGAQTAGGEDPDEGGTRPASEEGVSRRPPRRPPAAPCLVARGRPGGLRGPSSRRVPVRPGAPPGDACRSRRFRARVSRPQPVARVPALPRRPRVQGPGAAWGRVPGSGEPAGSVGKGAALACGVAASPARLTGDATMRESHSPVGLVFLSFLNGNIRIGTTLNLN